MRAYRPWAMALSEFSPSTPFPRPGDSGQALTGSGEPVGDGLDDMSKAELAATADGLGLPKSGNKHELIERIRRHRAAHAGHDQGAGESESVPGDEKDGPTPEEDADQTGSDAHPTPDHDGVTDPDGRDDPNSDETATIGD